MKRGIPHHFRGIVWQLLCGAHDSSDKAKYADYIKATSACEKVKNEGKCLVVALFGIALPISKDYQKLSRSMF